MRARIAAIAVALVLATIGTGVLLAFVRSAESRARAGEAEIDVVVATEPIPAGTPVRELASSVEVRQVPVEVQAEGNVGSLERLASAAGKVTAIDLLPGEQIVASRLVEVGETTRRPGAVDVADDLVEITVSVEPQRALGGSVQPGDTVGVIASFEPFELGGVAGDTTVVDGQIYPADGKTPNTSHYLLHTILVTNVQLEELPRQIEDAETLDISSTELAPTGNLLVTLALDKASAERVAFAGEFGFLWLTGETADADQDGIEIQTRGSVYLSNGRNVR